MSATLNTEVEVVTPEGRTSTVLKRNALGLPALFFCIATAAAPMTALLFNVPVIVSGSGWAAPAAFLVATVMLLIFTVGYIEMSRRVTTAGGFYSFVSHGFGQTLGLGTASVVTASYAILAAAIIGVFGYFANTTIDSWLHINIPVWVLMFGVLLVDLAFAWFDIRITARVLGVFFIAEVLGALILAFAILLVGGDNGLSTAPLNPLKLFNNQAAIAVFGAAAPGIALFGAFWSWVGFEMAPNYGEETRRPKHIFGRATFGTLIVLGIVYVLVTYAFVEGWGTNHVAQAVKAQFSGQTISAFYPLTGRYVGAWLTSAFKVLIITSSFACQLAFFNTAARYLFALGRERLLPSALGRTHGKHKTPHVAAIVLACALALYILGFVISDPSTIAALTKLATWSPLLGVFGILAVQALVSFAIVRYFWTVDRAHFHPWRTLIAPLLGGRLMVFSAFLLLKNRDALAGASGVPFVEAIPWVMLAIFGLGVAAALWFRLRDTARYEAVGRFVHEEA
jgi:amino acid transporter